MPETISEKSVFSLLEVTLSIKKTITERYKSTFWVKAEMNKLNLYSHSGHCYPELVEKQNGKVVALLKGIIWKEDYIRINSQFQAVLKEPLRNGINILFCARITFDPGFGLSLQILDIDPVYSLGELEREKQESIDRLKAAGIFDLNKKIAFPLLPQRIAIISVETSKGYADFISVIDGNQWNYRFFHMLFPALLQGEKAIAAIRAQLGRIRKVLHHFDVVAIIRGGGGDVGLSCYNNFLLSRDIAEFPLPVLTGIGHATNETVAEMISYRNAITPTALASFLLQSFHNFAVPVQDAKELLPMRSRELMREKNTELRRMVVDFKNATRHGITANKNQISHLTNSVIRQAKYLFSKEKEHYVLLPSRINKAVFYLHQQQHRSMNELAAGLKRHSAALTGNGLKEIIGLERIIKSLSPEQVMKRGYSITRVNGSVVRSIAAVKKGDAIESLLADGTILSHAEKISKNKTNEQ